MPLDTNIALGIRQPEQPNMLAQMAQAMAIRGANQEYDSQNALSDSYQKMYANGKRPNAEQITNDLAQRGYGHLIPKLQKQFADTANTESTTAKNRATTVKEELGTSVGQLAGVTDVPGYFDWVAASHDKELNPALADFYIRQGTNAEKAKAHAQAVFAQLGPEAGLAELKKGAMGAVPALFKVLNQSEDNKQTNAQSARNNAATVGAAMYGHNVSKSNAEMADTRQRYQFDNPHGLMTEDEQGNKVLVNPINATSRNVLAPGVVIQNGLAQPSPQVANLTAPGTPVTTPTVAQPPPALTPQELATASATNAPAPATLKGKPTALTEFQGKATGFAMRANQAHQDLAAAEKLGTNQPGITKRVLESTPFIGEGLGTASNFTQSPDQQKVEQAQRNFVNAILRQESGAAINADEFANARKQYFPQPGDKKEVIEQKRANRESAIKSLEIGAGPGMKQVPKPDSSHIDSLLEKYK